MQKKIWNSIMLVTVISVSVLAVLIFASSGFKPELFFAILLIILFAAVLAKRAAKKIVEPINNADLMQEDIVLYDELSGFVRAIATYRKRAELQISKIESTSNMINAIIGSIKEGIVLLDCQGIIVTANKSALLLFKASGMSVLGKHIIELTRHKEILEKTQQALSGSNCEFIYKKHKRIYQIFFSPATEGGVIILFLDITEKMNAEKMRKEFSANVTHELKTPLTNISGYAEMMSSGIAKADDYAYFSAKIKDETARLILLIDDILMLSRLDEQTGDVEKQEIDLLAIAKQVVEAFAEKAVDNNISLAVKGNAMRINANGGMIYELLFNLVDNGIKYNKPDGAVLISFSQENDKVCMKVEDNGIGIALKHQHRIFERFYRVDKSRSKKTGGTGLGLSIAKHIVEVHAGTIYIESKEGIGTSVVVRF